jgi:hypothetical protein
MNTLMSSRQHGSGEPLALAGRRVEISCESIRSCVRHDIETILALGGWPLLCLLAFKLTHAGAIAPAPH